MSVVSVDIPVATESSDGLLSAADKTKIDAGGGGGAVASVFGRTGAVVAVSGDYNLGLLPDVANALSGKVSTSLVGTANGVASLGSDGKVPSAQLPTVSSTSLTVAAYGTSGTVGASKESFAIVRPTAATTYPITTDTTVKFISVVNKGTATATVSGLAIWAGASQCFIRDPSNNSWLGI